MDRRSALKMIGIGMGATVTSGTILSTFLASCKSDGGGKAVEGALFIKDAKQYGLIQQMADIILPKTDTPSASEVGVMGFIDASVAQLYTPEQQMNFQKGMEVCTAALEAEQGAKVSSLQPTQIEEFLHKHIGNKADKAAAEARDTMLGEKTAPSDPKAANEYYLYNFLNAVKSMTVAGYFGSEMIGENHLNYDPVPGPYQGCIPYDGGKVYSLS